MEGDFIDPSTLTIEQLQPKRPKTGNDVSVVLWRLIRLVGMHNILKEETPIVSYLVGKQIGRMFKPANVAELKQKLIDMKVGVIEVTKETDSSVHIAFGECLTCAGITPPLGKAICQLEAGLVAGALENIYPGRKVSGVETKCMGGLGDDVCLIECSIL
jgi:predicted hydrocarbon binding protein